MNVIAVVLIEPVLSFWCSVPIPLSSLSRLVGLPMFSLNRWYVAVSHRPEYTAMHTKNAILTFIITGT